MSTNREEHLQSLIAEAEILAEKPHNWPEVDAETFTITVDMDSDPEDHDRPYLVLRVGEFEIYRRPTWYESTTHINLACKDMREAYLGRVKNFELTPAAEYGIVMDDGKGYAKLRRAFRPLRKDYEKTQIKAKKSSAKHEGAKD